MTAASGARSRPVSTDLVAVVVSMLVVVVLFMLNPGRSVRLLVGTPILLLGPGYAIVQALFPERFESEQVASTPLGFGLDAASEASTDEIISRLSFSLVFSIVSIAFVSLVLVATSLSFTSGNLLYGLTAISVLGAVAAVIRRRRAERGSVFVPNIGGILTPVSRRARSGDNHIPVMVLTVCLLLASAGVGAAFVWAQPGYTEFYLQNPGDGQSHNVSDLPQDFTVGESKDLTVGIENHEHETKRYTVIVRLERVEVTNGTTTIQSLAELARFTPRIETNESWERTHQVTPDMTGERLRLTYLLYAGDPPADPTAENAKQNLHLWISVTATENNG